MKNRIKWLIIFICLTSVMVNVAQAEEGDSQTQIATSLTESVDIDEVSEISLLNNRFRIDPSIKKVTFLIHRKEKSSPAIIIRPDGVKYYAWKHPDRFAWHSEPTMDIITIENPMPGPWQAIGEISTKNKIILLSNVAINVDTIPERLYQDEHIKFTASVTENGKPLKSREFLGRVQLTVVAYKYVENEASLPEFEKPTPIVLGEFFDTGESLDEKAFDSTFTVDLDVKIPPGQYRLRVISHNEIFLRSFERIVYVFPAPVHARLVESSDPKKSHEINASFDPDSIVPGSFSAHIELQSPKGDVLAEEGSIDAKSAVRTLKLDFHDEPVIGRYRWYGWIYATDKYSQREVVFKLPIQSFLLNSLVSNDDEEMLAQKAKEEAEKEAERIALEKKQKMQKRLFWIIGISIFIIMLGVGGYLFWRWNKKRKQYSAALEMPPIDL